MEVDRLVPYKNELGSILWVGLRTLIVKVEDVGDRRFEKLDDDV